MEQQRRKHGTGGGQQPKVNANHNLLADRWWLDEYLRDETYAQIRRYREDGYTHREIARRVGCSDQTVLRYFRKQRA